MFYQDSNHLVKKAAVQSGCVENSAETRNIIETSMQPDGSGSVLPDTTDSTTAATTSSLDMGSRFINMIQGIVHQISTTETFSSGQLTIPSGGTVGGTSGSSGTAIIQQQVDNDNEYTAEQKQNIKTMDDIIKFIDKDNLTTRQKWVRVTDTAWDTKFGYITKDGIFQIWNVPRSNGDTDLQGWLTTNKMKQNAGVIGCPASSSSIQDIKITRKWADIKPYDLVYADNDKNTPLFILINTATRSTSNTPNGSGIFSCNNENDNVFVTQRPSADFEFKSPDVAHKMGCYTVKSLNDLPSIGFKLQEDLLSASISQCKRRAEDMGSSYFIVSERQSGNLPNRGSCWIFTGSGKPSIDGVLTSNSSNSGCYIEGNKEDDEDGFMKSYDTTTLPRLYGKKSTITEPENPPNPTCNHRRRDGCIFNGYKNEGNAACIPQTRTPRPNENGNCGYWANIGECDKNPGYMLYRCQTACQNSNSWKNSTIMNDARNFAYSIGGLASYDNNQLKGWLDALYNRNGDNVERAAVAEYRERCKNTKGYEFLDDKPQKPRTRIEITVALYSLKIGGTNGVDTNNQNSIGSIGKLAYIDRNGQRHDYPASALSFTATKDQKGLSYINMGNYDTRSIESSYSLKEIKPGDYSEASNLLYKASRDGWTPEAFHQRCDNKGPTYTRAIIRDGRVLGAYTSVSWSSDAPGYKGDPQSFLYDGKRKYTPNNGAWGTNPPYSIYMQKSYLPTFGGGHDFYINGKTLGNNAYTFLADGDRGAPFGRKYTSYESYTLSDLEVYAITSPTFPQNLEYAVRLRTMPIGESIKASMSTCQSMCDADEKCGGYVYTKGSGNADEKCELKDRSKMYPIGLRVADPAKQLMYKVPYINESISDNTCKGDNGNYNAVNTVQYAHYPNGGAMASSTVCDIRKIIPQAATTTPANVNIMVKGVNEVTKSLNSEISSTPGYETFTVREGLTAYEAAIADLSSNLRSIANNEFQRERLIAMTDESNKLLITESYKFILWSILAILLVLAVIKLKEMFGQDDADEDDGGGDSSGGGGGFLATLLGFFGMNKIDTSDIADKTGDVKDLMKSTGEKLMESTNELSTNITEGADNLVSSASDAATQAVEGAKGLADKVSETATDSVNKIGDTISSSGSGSGSGNGSSNPSKSTTVGGKSRKNGSRTRRTK